MRLINKVLNSVRKSIAWREDDFRIRIGSQHVSQHRFLVGELQNLWDVEVRVFSQWGEDGILDYLLHRLDISKPKVLELGAGCFGECNSKFLAYNRNASVYAVDLRGDLPAGIAKSGLMWRNSLFWEVTKVTTGNIREISSRAFKLMNGIDLVSIDLDGNDYWILKEMNLEEVSIVVAEYNPIFGLENSLTVINKDLGRYERHSSGLLFGASFAAMVKLMKSKKFVFVGTNRVGNNAFFVRDGLESSLKVKIPKESEFYKYLDWRCREARGENGTLVYQTVDESIKLISESKVFNIESSQEVSISDLFSS